MPSTAAFAVIAPFARALALRGSVGLSLLSLPAPMGAAAAATLGKTYYFATREACLASGAFSARECAMAFANARAQLRDHAPRFPASGECQLHFRICQAAGPGASDEDAPPDGAEYVPSALGIEMIASATGVEAAPTLAVEPQTRLFPLYPVSKSYEPEQAGQSVHAKGEQQNAAILPTDHFEPFSRRKPFAGKMTFTASALGSIDAPRDGIESPEQRRLRLRMAPFVE